MSPPAQNCAGSPAVAALNHGDIDFNWTPGGVWLYLAQQMLTADPLSPVCCEVAPPDQTCLSSTSPRCSVGLRWGNFDTKPLKLILALLKPFLKHFCCVHYPSCKGYK